MVTIRRIAARRSTPTVRRRWAPALLAVGLGLGVLPLLAPAATAALGSQGPTDPATGIPTFFADATAVRLAPCFAGAPNCPGTQASFAGGTSPAMYFSGAATLPTAAAPGVTPVASNVLMALEATQPGPSVFQRVQFQIQVPAPGTYTVTYPYGAQQFNVTTLSTTPGQDILTTTDSPALSGPIGPFLQWSGSPPAPAGFIGDGATPHAVIGSPANRNFFRVQGTGINPNTADVAHACPAPVTGPDCVQTTLFTITGEFAPALSASPASLTWTNQTVGTTSAPQTVTLKNAGTRPVAIGSTSTTGPFAAAASAPANTCAGTSLAVGATCSVTVTFTPTAAGPSTGSLLIASNDPGSPLTVPLTGSTPAPGAGLSPTTVNFANQPTGTTSGAQTVTVSNTGTAPLNVSAVAIAGANPGDFAQTNTCVGAPVNPGASCAANVTFAPAVSGARSASLTFTDDAPASPQSVALSGTGTAPAPAVGFNPPNMAFANQTANTTSPTQTVTITNTGNANLNVSTVAVTGTNPGDFAQTNTCVGTPIPPAGTCSASITFTPAATGPRSASLSVTDDAPGSPHALPLSGTGVPPAPAAAVAPAALAFGQQANGTASPASPVTLTNTGSAPMTVSAVSMTGVNPGDFAQTNNCVGGSIAPGASCSASVTFSPTATGARSANVSFTDNAPGSPHVVALSGTGVNVAARTSTAAVTFPDQRTATTSAPRTVQLINTGGAPLNISGVTVTGDAVQDFAVGNDTCSGAQVAPGATCSVDVVFHPTASLGRSASLSFADDAPTSPQTVALSGTGIAPTLSVNPSSIDFGTRFLLATAARRVTVTNTGNAPMTMGTTTVTGANAADFVVDSNTCTKGTVVAPGASCTIALSFHPGFIGNRAANLTITSDADNSPKTVVMTGAGTILPV